MVVLSLSLKLKNHNETEADEVGIRVGYELMGDDGLQVLSSTGMEL